MTASEGPSALPDGGSRRVFLVRTLSGTLFLFLARWVPARLLTVLPQNQTADALRYFSGNELRIVRAIAERIIGPPAPGNPTASSIDVAARADRYLAGADQRIQEQFHLLLTLFNARLFTFLFDFRTQSFVDMSPDDQDSYLENWMTSPIAFRRTGFQALKRLCTGMFYTQSKAWDELGYRPFLSRSEAR